VESVGGPAPNPANATTVPIGPSGGDHKKSLQALPLFKKAAESLGAQIWHVDEGFNPMAAASTPGAEEDVAPLLDSDEV
jgi:hypothetical protein